MRKQKHFEQAVRETKMSFENGIVSEKLLCKVIGREWKSPTAVGNAELTTNTQPKYVSHVSVSLTKF